MVFVEKDLVSCAAETCFIEKNYLDLSEDEEEESDSNNENFELLGVEATNSNGRGHKNPAMKKVVTIFHKKWTQVCSNKQALRKIAKCLQTVAESQNNRMTLSLQLTRKGKKENVNFVERNLKEIDNMSCYMLKFR